MIPARVGADDYTVLGHILQTGPDFQLDLTIARRVRVTASGAWAILGSPGNRLSLSASYDPLPGIRLEVGSEFIGGPPGSRFADTEYGALLLAGPLRVRSLIPRFETAIRSASDPPSSRSPKPHGAEMRAIVSA